MGANRLRGTGIGKQRMTVCRPSFMAGVFQLIQQKRSPGCMQMNKTSPRSGEWSEFRQRTYLSIFVRSFFFWMILGQHLVTGLLS